MKIWIDINALKVKCIYSGKIEVICIERIY